MPGGQVTVHGEVPTIPSSKIGIVTCDARLGDGFDRYVGDVGNSRINWA